MFSKHTQKKHPHSFTHYPHPLWVFIYLQLQLLHSGETWLRNDPDLIKIPTDQSWFPTEVRQLIASHEEGCKGLPLTSIVELSPVRKF